MIGNFNLIIYLIVSAWIWLLKKQRPSALDGSVQIIQIITVTSIGIYFVEYEIAKTRTKKTNVFLFV